MFPMIIFCCLSAEATRLSVRIYTAKEWTNLLIHEKKPIILTLITPVGLSSAVNYITTNKFLVTQSTTISSSINKRWTTCGMQISLTYYDKIDAENVHTSKEHCT